MCCAPSPILTLFPMLVEYPQRDTMPEGDRPPPARLDPDIERMLRAYMRGKQGEESLTVVEVRKLGDTFLLHDQKDERLFGEVQTSLKGLASRLDALERDQEVTGSWVREGIAKDTKRAKFRAWLKHRGLTLAFEIVKYTLIIAVSATVAHFLTKAALPVKVDVSP